MHLVDKLEIAMRMKLTAFGLDALANNGHHAADKLVVGTCKGSLMQSCRRRQSISLRRMGVG
jgi:hypothetical protein